jgi:hypothetical protein
MGRSGAQGRQAQQVVRAGVKTHDLERELESRGSKIAIRSVDEYGNVELMLDTPTGLLSLLQTIPADIAARLVKQSDRNTPDKTVFDLFSVWTSGYNLGY